MKDSSGYIVIEKQGNCWEECGKKKGWSGFCSYCSLSNGSPGFCCNPRSQGGCSAGMVKAVRDSLLRNWIIIVFVLSIHRSRKIIILKGQRIIINVWFQKRWMMMKWYILKCLIAQTVGQNASELDDAIIADPMAIVAMQMDVDHVLGTWHKS